MTNHASVEVEQHQKFGSRRVGEEAGVGRFGRMDGFQRDCGNGLLAFVFGEGVEFDAREPFDLFFPGVCRVCAYVDAAPVYLSDSSLVPLR